MNALLSLRWFVVFAYVAVAADAVSQYLRGAPDLIQIMVASVALLFAVGIVLRLTSVVLLSMVSFPLLVLLHRYGWLMDERSTFALGLLPPFHYVFAWLSEPIGSAAEVLSSPAPFSWGLAALHGGLLSPVCFELLRDREGANPPAADDKTLVADPKPAGSTPSAPPKAKSAPRVNLPEAVWLYQRNPYRILGLRPVDTAARVAKRRGDELAQLLEHDLSLEEHLPEFVSIPVPGAPGITVEDVARAATVLAYDRNRFGEAVFWFHLDVPVEKWRVEHGMADAATLRQVWTQQLLDPERQSTAALNLAVLEHATVLAVEAESAQAGVLAPAQRAAWRACLDAWVAVYEDDGAWRRFDELRAKSTDPSITAEYIADLRLSLPRLVVAINVAIAAKALEAGNLDYARAHVELVRASRFPEADLEAALAELFAPLVAEVKRHLQVLVGPTHSLDGAVDYAQLSQRIAPARTQLEALGGLRALSPLLESLLRTMRQNVISELIRSVNAFWSDVNHLRQLNNKIIEFWNDASPYAEHVFLAEKMKEQQEPVAQLVRDADKLQRKAVLAVAALTLLRSLCAPEDGDSIRELEENLTQARVETHEPSTVAQGVRQHWSDNNSGMQRQVG